MPIVIEMKIMKRYEGKPLKDAIYALEVAKGYYEVRAIQRGLEKLKRS